MLVQHELQNAYIWEYHEPTSKTLFYAPCETDLIDTISGNTPSGSYNASLSWWYLYCNKWYCHWTLAESYDRWKPRTINVYFKISWRATYNWRIIRTNNLAIWCSNQQNLSKYNIPLWTISNGWDDDAHKAYVIANCPTTNLDQWYNVCMTNNGTITKMYLNGVSFIPPWQYWTTTSTITYIGCWTTNNYDKYYWYIGDLLFESWAWTDAEVLAYFNSTKSKYGVS